MQYNSSDKSIGLTNIYRHPGCCPCLKTKKQKFLFRNKSCPFCRIPFLPNYALYTCFFQPRIKIKHKATTVSMQRWRPERELYFFVVVALEKTTVLDASGKKLETCFKMHEQPIFFLIRCACWVGIKH